MAIRLFGLGCVVAACVASVGCNGGNNSSGSPTGPDNSGKVIGGWTGTLTRPGGQVLTLKWDAGLVSAPEGQNLSGNMTITGPSGNTTSVAKGITAGNDKNGYSIFIQFTDTTPQAPCSVKANSATQTGDSYPSPYTTITVPSLQVFVNGQCQGIFDGAGTQNVNLQEFVRMVLTKQ
jgi:hypothetical protein